MNKYLPRYKTKTITYLIYGILFGCCFPIIAILIDLHLNNLDFSFQNIKQIHSLCPIHYIIHTAPFFLGLMAFYCGWAYDRVQEKNEEIIEASRFKDNFLASMSHEIRTPMSGIIGVIDLLEKSENIKKKESDYIDIIKTSSNDLMVIINDILDLSKIDAGKLNIKPVQTNLRNTSQHIKNLFLAIGKSKNIELKIEIDEDVPKIVLIDEIRIKQVLSNLIGNAIKFSDRGVVILKISVLNLEAEDVQLKFEVIDQGIGINENQLNTLFSAYKRLGDYSSRHTHGTGLGLLICKQIVGLMGGMLAVKSKEGKGSNFNFVLDLIISVIKDNECKNIIEVEDNNDLKHLNLKILSAEDNKTLCILYTKIFKELGCEFIIVNNGQELIDTYKENTFDIVLLDINMPVMGGVEAMQYLRENYKKLPSIVAVSASALKGDREKYVNYGFDDYLPKPFKLEDLSSKLAKNIAKKGSVQKTGLNYL